ncbi:MAG TPA: gamma-glutamyltransferase [Xanthobacteraceae bacterium]|nr:gamma-glutamyltransferase [Xanthobacteraceae bacterium]
MSHANGPRTGRPPTRASRGMVSAPHHLASASGLDALRRGGKAVDAAIAANAILCVAYPHMAGLEGDGFWLTTDPETEGVQALDASGQQAIEAPRWLMGGPGALHPAIWCSNPASLMRQCVNCVFAVSPSRWSNNGAAH